MDAELRDEVHLKDLAKVKRLGFDLRRVLIVEDEPKEGCSELWQRYLCSLRSSGLLTTPNSIDLC